MVGRALSASSAPVASTKVAMLPAAKSRGGCRRDLHFLRVHFPDRWARFLRDHFNGDPSLIQFFFGCSERQARDWLAAKNSPRAEVVIFAAQRFPGVMAELTRDAA